MAKVRIGAKERGLRALRERRPAKAGAEPEWDEELVGRVMKMRERRRAWMRDYMKAYRRKHRGKKT